MTTRLGRWGRRVSCVTALLLAACSTPEPTQPPKPTSATTPASTASGAPTMPEGASGLTTKPGWSATRFMVAAANPLATEAGYRILKADGTALDAAIAVQMVLSLVEPQSSGIGGGAFLLHWDGSALAAWDGRETAPTAADGKLLLAPSGRPVPFLQAAVG